MRKWNVGMAIGFGASDAIVREKNDIESQTRKTRVLRLEEQLLAADRLEDERRHPRELLARADWEKQLQACCVMVGFESSRRDERASSHAMAGAVSGTVTRFLCQPLDVIKIRFQVEPLSARCVEAKYWGVLQAGTDIVHNEGMAALWKGHVPAQLLSVIYGTTQFVTFEALTRQAWRLALLQSEELRPALNFSCGAVAGCAATVVSFPADVVRTRLVAQGDPGVYKGLINSFVVIYKTEGIPAFFKGLLPSLIQIAPHAGAQFAFYSGFRDLWKRYEASVPATAATDMTVAGSLVCGSAAGLCAKTIVYPLDLSKKRLQMQGFEAARRQFGKVFRCAGLVDCVRQVVRHEGLAGLFKGLWPSAIKAATTTALHFCIYEQVCHLLASHPC
ncbi:mitochondrial thiamine pyrophosphate carrier-like isoform X2 [Bacillus rossius redtenbacheri]|uniref:mitochondrial thiamine pyrophosphate carrier-like isoform X2 n=1 Tax=Bacillus rossius redtenbacheri TaxID=93214 RepID=UPI002FDD1843